MFVAGKPPGVILIADDRRGLDIESEEMATGGRQKQSVKLWHARRGRRQGVGDIQRLTSVLVP